MAYTDDLLKKAFDSNQKFTSDPNAIQPLKQQMQQPVMNPLTKAYSERLTEQATSSPFLMAKGYAPEEEGINVGLTPEKKAKAFELAQEDVARAQEVKQKQQDELASQYQKSQEVAQKLGLPAPKLPQQLVGTSYDLAKQAALSPEDQKAKFLPAQYDMGIKAPEKKEQIGGGLLGAYDKERQAVLAEGQAQADLYKAKATALENYRTAVAETDKEAKSKEDARQKQMEEQQKNYLSALDDVQKAAQIDPNRIWNNKSTGQKITAGIALLLGGIGQGLTKGSSNAALNVIDNEITQDIDAQKTALAGKKELAEGQKGVYSMMLNKFGDERIAEKAAKDAGYQNVLLKLNSIEASSSNPIVKAKAQQAAAQIQEKSEMIRTQLQQYAQDQSSLRTGGGDPSKMTKEQLAVWGLTAPGFEGYARDKEDAKRIRQLSGDINGAKDSINRLMEIAGTTGRSLSLDDRAEAKTLQQTLVGQLRTALLGPGTINETERKNMEEIIADPTKFLSLSSIDKKRLSTLMKTLDMKMNSAAKSAGYTVKSPQDIQKQVGFEAIR